MPKVEPIKVLTVDEVPMNVAELSAAVKQLVAVFDDWNQQETDARSNLMMVSAAKDQLSRQIVNQIRLDQEAKEKEAKDAAPASDEVAPPTEDTVAVTGDAAE